MPSWHMPTAGYRPEHDNGGDLIRAMTRVPVNCTPGDHSCGRHGGLGAVILLCLMRAPPPPFAGGVEGLSDAPRDALLT